MIAKTHKCLFFRFDDEIDNYKMLKLSLQNKLNEFDQVVMTTTTKQLASERLDGLIRKIEHAIKETKYVQKFWTDTSNVVESLRKHASMAKGYISNEEKKEKFEYLFDHLKSLFDDWKRNKDIAIQVAKIFN